MPGLYDFIVELGNMRHEPESTGWAKMDSSERSSASLNAHELTND